MKPNPGTALSLHYAVADLRRMLHTEDEQESLRARREREREREREAEAADYRRRNYWKTLARPARAALVFQALGGEALTIGEITDAVQGIVKEHGNVHESNVRSVVSEMYKAGELARSAHYRGQRVYHRYFQPTDLMGPIADLERHFNGPK